ncbi:alpha/beta hydrolase [Actinocorallia sp. A-T 12471]|uniref:poly(ethylene terephthalate) hydrolase family protein n=1 Tax=Actinocorallia sp. A-T 12471 TaxID=3089813 RepID=UPI0029D2D4B7|nr:alpha/beta hydrolase [Actinocorallia sp. A-T 12471]MDX6739243.1 alpha/beta hydrolase [Actinocorallia sp. A-T 12471]
MGWGRRVLRVLVVVGVVVAAHLPPGPALAAAGGSGPYPADYETTVRLPGHTVYRPVNLPSGKLPIVAWGNGACRADGTWFENILKEFASHGFLVIANGRPGGTGRTNARMLTEAIDWAIAENTRLLSRYRGKIDTTKIAVMGQSCGGLEAYEASADRRVTTTGIFNSGMLDDANNVQLTRLHAPVIYLVGGPDDIAHPNALDDWDRLPAGLPAFMGNLNVGHMGTYAQPNGGEFGRVASAWLKWQLKGDTVARSLFVGADCGLCGTAWEVRQKNLS